MTETPTKGKGLKLPTSRGRVVLLALGAAIVVVFVVRSRKASAGLVAGSTDPVAPSAIDAGAGAGVSDGAGTAGDPSGLSALFDAITTGNDYIASLIVGDNNSGGLTPNYADPSNFSVGELARIGQPDQNGRVIASPFSKTDTARLAHFFGTEYSADDYNLGRVPGFITPDQRNATYAAAASSSSTPRASSIPSAPANVPPGQAITPPSPVTVPAAAGGDLLAAGRLQRAGIN